MILWWTDTFAVAGGQVLASPGPVAILVTRDLPVIDARDRELPALEPGK